MTGLYVKHKPLSLWCPENSEKSRFEEAVEKLEIRNLSFDLLYFSYG